MSRKIPNLYNISPIRKSKVKPIPIKITHQKKNKPSYENSNILINNVPIWAPLNFRIISKLECPICYEFFSKCDAESLGCEHLVCQDCRPHIEECPICRHPLTNLDDKKEKEKLHKEKEDHWVAKQMALGFDPTMLYGLYDEILDTFYDWIEYAIGEGHENLEDYDQEIVPDITYKQYKLIAEGNLDKLNKQQMVKLYDDLVLHPNKQEEINWMNLQMAHGYNLLILCGLYQNLLDISADWYQYAINRDYQGLSSVNLNAAPNMNYVIYGMLVRKELDISNENNMIYIYNDLILNY